MTPKIEDTILKEVAEIVYQASGIVFKDSNLAVLTSRLMSKCKEKGLSEKEYVAKLRLDENELRSFIDFVTTNFTSFFRNLRHFELLKNEVLPVVIERNKENRSIRIWSAGSSTGEEAYTIAIVVCEYFDEHSISLSDWNIQIMGSDISLDSLFIAKEGKYPARSVQKIDQKLINKYFTRTEDRRYYIIKDSVKEMVSFDYHNLMYNSNFEQIDIIFCRNVLIYFDEDIQKKVLSKLYLAGRPDSFLFIGHSESLIGLFEKFQPVSFDQGILYVRK